MKLGSCLCISFSVFAILEFIFIFIYFLFFRTRSIEQTKEEQAKHSIHSDYIKHARRNFFKPSHLCVNMNSIAG